MPNPLIKQVLIEDTDTLYDVYDESADHGGGGGGDTPFRVINEITVAEDSQAIIIDKDSNNQPFSIKELLIEIETPAAASELNNQTLYCSLINTQWAGTNNLDFTCYYSIRTTKSLMRIHMAMQGGLVFSDAVAQPDANNDYFAQPRLYNTIHALGGNIKNFGISRTSITSICLRILEAANFRAGTKITMYGR